VNVLGGRGKARIGLLAATAIAVVGLSGCETSPGAAALVGDFRISTETLQAAVNEALADPGAEASYGADRAGFTRTQLGRLISNQVIATAAAAEDITVTPSEIDTQIDSFAQQAGGMEQLIRSAAEGGVPESELRSFVRYYVLEQKLGDALVADAPVSQADLEAAYQQNIDQYDQVHSAHILVKSKALADDILAEVRRTPSRFAALAAENSIDTSNKDDGGDLGFAGRGQFVPSFSDAIFSAKPDSFVEVHTKFGWHVVHVIERTRTTLAEATPELKAGLLQDTRTQLLSQTLTEQARTLGVHVNPRYGRWDAAQATVVPVGDGGAVSSPSPAA
jgi:parvulin-like peptidyl-prolyl isomerase